MNADDFFRTTLVSGAADPWSPLAQVPTRDGLDETFLDSLRRGHSPKHP